MPARPPPLALLALLLPLASACAYSMVRGDHVREDAFADVLARTAAARHLPVPDAYDTRVIERDALPGLLRDAIVADWTAEELADYQDTLVALGAWPPDRDLVDEYVAISREELAGIYVPADATLYVVEDPPAPLSVRVASTLLQRDLLLELVLAHELVHLLQHGAYPRLLEEDADWRSQDDVTSAVHAALEGDATRFGLVAVLGQEAPLPSPEEFRSDLEAEQAGGGGALARAPAMLRLTLAFPYAWGYPLSMSEGAALLDDPPASTEQVLHPERRREAFLAIDLAAAHDRLPQGCRLLGENTLGELGISVLLRDLGEAPPPATWEGWDGDRYLAARCDERRAFVWETWWDRKEDAVEFANGYASVATRVQQRAGLAEPPRILLDGRRVRISSSPLHAVADALDTHARRARVATLSQLRTHFPPDN